MKDIWQVWVHQPLSPEKEENPAVVQTSLQLCHQWRLSLTNLCRVKTLVAHMQILKVWGPRIGTTCTYHDTVLAGKGRGQGKSRGRSQVQWAQHVMLLSVYPHLAGHQRLGTGLSLEISCYSWLLRRGKSCVSQKQTPPLTPKLPDWEHHWRLEEGCTGHFRISTETDNSKMHDLQLPAHVTKFLLYIAT